MLLVMAQHYTPVPVKWNYTFGKSYKMPYGCMVLRKSLLPALFGEDFVLDNDRTFYEDLDNFPEGKKNLICITSSLNPGKLDLDKLFEFVSNGNNALIAAFQFPQKLLDTLNTNIEFDLPDSGLLSEHALVLNFVNPGLRRKEGYEFKRSFPELYFSGFDTIHTLILGQDDAKNINFIRVDFGQGAFYLHSLPPVFTNYHLLYSNYQYASAALSYLPKTYTIWDEYYKPVKNIIKTPVRFILSQKSLKAAYFLLLFGIFLYMLFEGKRVQRAIPVIKPPRNMALDFIDTIGRLYLRSNDHRDLAMKKIIYFNESVLSRFAMNMNETSEEKLEKLSRKSGVDLALIEKIYRNQEYIFQQQKISAGKLFEFHQMIQEFNNTCY